MIKWVLLLCLSFCLTGCWDKKDPEERIFILALGVDHTEEGCRFTFSPADIEKGETKIYEAESGTLAGAIAQVDTRTSRRTDLGQLKTIIFSEEILSDQKKLEALLRELERSQTVSEKVMLLATQDSAADCVAAVMAEDGKTGLFLWDFYKNTAREVAVTKGMDLDTFLTERTEREGRAVFPRISVEEEKLELGGGIAIGKTGVFPLSDTEERGYLFLLGEAEGALLEGEYRGEILPLEIGRSAVAYDFFPQGEGVLCQVRLSLEGTLQGGKVSFLSPQEQEAIERLFADIIKDELVHTMKIAEDAGEDLFGILTRLRQKEPSLEVSWEALKFEFLPEVSLKDMGRKR